MTDTIRLTVDVAVFTDPGNDLQVLLIQRGNDPFKGQWALPGGFVDYGESLETAARRELKEETNIRVNDLIQVGAFGNPKRDPRGHIVSVAFATFVPPSEMQKIKGADDAADARWFSVNKLPELAFDHSEILKEAKGIPG